MTNARADDHRQPVAVDLFSGAGGLSNGLTQSGFDVRVGLDFDKHALATYEANHSGSAMLADVTRVKGSDLMKEAGTDRIDLLAGGPSCQGFSTHGKRIAEDPRNFLYVEFMRLVEEIRPTTVLIENVKGLLWTGKGAYKREIYESFGRMGYQVDARVLHAIDFGVPQRRHRVFFVATRKETPLLLPMPTHGSFEGAFAPVVTLDNAISDLPLRGATSHTDTTPYASGPQSSYQAELRGSMSEVWNHVESPLSELAASVVRHIAPGKGLRSLPSDKLPSRFQKMRRISNGELRSDCTTLYHRLHPDEPSYTVTCNFKNVSSGAFTHPHVDRAITPREAARLQSFPDDFVFKGASIPRQIGNAVPPKLARAVGNSIRDHLVAA